MRVPDVLYRFYENSLARGLSGDKLPHHVGVLVDGNRRWAKLAGAPTAHGHQAGADKIVEFITWCEELGIKVVTLYMLSTDNLNRSSSELEQLMGIIGNTVDRLGESKRVRIQPVGAKDLLPAELSEKLAQLAEETRSCDGVHVNVAIGYGGRREIVDAVRDFMLEASAAGKSLDVAASEIDVDAISRHLYTKGQPDPDLLIRTSGEQRLSGFLTWQSAYSEFYFCEALWPDFRRVDFLRALRDYADRQRRFGS
ncbi:short-chain Z-isoprenyl diphosphate synthase [Neomicrococcus aestuarii]|uniref:Isoprenyl transferase n=1 Tax=Neomicrococcus aestuarii TaxID=556325 RepID=A0A7W8X055_9MICC|nr:isoprenyl transferase [Neomicrococcus aestuarii]MBB5511384.1 short-chain Z-isoprenyl diphosphate synthase [Neomicrococcus aestuarii]